MISVSAAAVGTILAAYFVGAIPFGVIFGKWLAGRDPRTVGSRNIGFTNVLRGIGFAPAILTLAGDLAKGAAGAYAGMWVGGPFLGAVSGLAAVLGHCYPIYLGFHGGKAVATGFGVLSVLYPFPGVITFGLWAIVTGVSRYVSLGSVVAFACLPGVLMWFDPGADALILGLGMAFLVILRHAENIKRLRARQEKRLFDRESNV